MRTPGGGVDEEDAGDPRSVADVLPGCLTGRTLAIIQTADVVVREPLEGEDDDQGQHRRHGKGLSQGPSVHPRERSTSLPERRKRVSGWSEENTEPQLPDEVGAAVREREAKAEIRTTLSEIVQSPPG